MSVFKEPFNPGVKLGCGGGHHQDRAEHDAESIRTADPKPCSLRRAGKNR